METSNGGMEFYYPIPVRITIQLTSVIGKEGYPMYS